MRVLIGGMVLLLGLSSALAQPARDAVLKHVPEKAPVVALIPSGAKLITGVADFGKAIGVDEMAALSLADVLEELEIPAAEAIDTDAFAAFVVLPELDDGVLICTVKDADKWKTDSGAKPGEEGLLAIPDNEEFKFALDGSVLMMSPKPEAVKAAVAGSSGFADKLKGRAADELGKSQIVVWIDVAAMEPLMREGLGELESSIGSMMSMAGPQGAAMEGMAKWAMGEIRTLVSDTQFAVFVGRIGADGVHIVKHVTFKADSGTATCLKGLKKSKEDLLRGLPDAPFALAFGCEWTGSGDKPGLMEAYLKAMMESFKPAEGASPDDFKAQADKTIAMLRKLSGFNGALSSSSDQKFVMSSFFFTDDARGVIDGLAAYNQVSQKMFGGMGMNVTVDIKQSQESIGGADATIYEYAFGGDDPTASKAIEAIYGAPMTAAAAPAPPGVAIAQGSGKSARDQLAKLLSSGAGLGENAQVKGAFDTIPRDPQFVMFIDLPRFAKLMMTAVAAAGIPLPPINFPEKVAPLITASLYLGEADVAFEMDVPTGAIKPVIDTVKSAMSPPPADQQ